jgi:hypothetical protein
MRLKAWTGALTCLLLNGCLVAEQTSVDVRLTSERAGSYRAEFRNVQSGAAGRDEQESDFKELVAMAHDDEYLLLAAGEGRYVQSRELVVEKGVVIGRETGLFRFVDSCDFPPLVRAADGSIRSKVEKGDRLVASNGKWVPDSSFVWWPAGTRDLRLTTRSGEFKPTASFATRLPAKATK